MASNRTMEDGNILAKQRPDQTNLTALASNRSMENKYVSAKQGPAQNNLSVLLSNSLMKGKNILPKQAPDERNLSIVASNSLVEEGYLLPERRPDQINLTVLTSNSSMKDGYVLPQQGPDQINLTVLASNSSMKDGYDLPIKGLDTDLFYAIHAVAISCIVVSLVCALLVFIFAIKKKTPFFKRLKCERFVVYLSICDGCFNVVHMMDHTQYLVTKSHPTPVGICSFYSFMMCVFVMAQMLCVNVIAINTFRMAYFGHNPNYGKWDYQLLSYMFGLPLCMAVLFVSLEQFGPNGYFCGFDGVKGGIILLLFTTIPTGIIIAINSLLYIITWSKLNQEAKRLKGTLGKDAVAVRASHNAAKSMSILVFFFIIQWTPSLVFGVWDMITQSPHEVVLVVVLTSNAGGILNGLAYIIIHKNKGNDKPNRQKAAKSATTSTTTKMCVASGVPLLAKKDPRKGNSNNVSPHEKRPASLAFGKRKKEEKASQTQMSTDASTEKIQSSTQCNAG